MAKTYYRLIEKDFDSEANNDWKWVENAPNFDTPSDAGRWLESQGIKYPDAYQAILCWAE